MDEGIGVEAVVNKWFDETLWYMSKQETGFSTRDATLIPGGLLCGRKYCKAVFALLSDGHKLPAAAIFRILFELDVKLRWCLQAPDKTDYGWDCGEMLHEFRAL